METLDKLLGIDPDDSQARHAEALAEEHFSLVEELVNARNRAGLNQDDVAKRMGVTQPTVSAIERLGKDLKLSTIRRYALAIGVVISHEIKHWETVQPEDEAEDKVAYMWDHPSYHVRMTVDLTQAPRYQEM